VPAAQLSAAVHPGYAWGSRAPNNTKTSSSRSSNTSSACTTSTDGSTSTSEGDHGRCSATLVLAVSDTVCAMSPDQLCSVLLGLVKWHRSMQARCLQQQLPGQLQQLEQPSQQQAPGLHVAWLDAVLGLIQVCGAA